MSIRRGQAHPLVVELCEVRKGLGLTQGEVAEQIGVSQAAVSLLESGRNWPTMRTVEAYAAAVGWQITVAPLPDLSEVPSCPQI